MDVEDVITLTIPYPSYIPRARGIHAVGKFGTALKAKCNKDEFDTVQHAADLIGISKSEFIRWCSYHAALRVIKESSREQGVEDDLRAS